MDPSNLETWKQQWTIFWSAPYIILPLIVVSLWVAWWFRGRTKEGEIAGLKAQMSVKDERLSFAVDGLDRARDDLANLDKQFLAYKMEVAANGKNASPVKMDAAILRIRDGDRIVRSNLLGNMFTPTTIGGTKKK
jgi:hypothetical protein